MPEHEAGEPMFYILSLKWTDGDECVWWNPDNAGYTTVLDRAGKYTREQVEAHPTYYNDGINTRAVPCEDAERKAIRVVSADHKLAFGDRFRDAGPPAAH